MAGDDERMAALLVSMLVACALAAAWPFLLWKARRWTLERRVVVARTFLGFALCGVCWVDTAVVLHAFDIEEGRSFYLHGAVVAFLSALWLALTPWRKGRWREALAGPAALALAAALLIHLPLSSEKAGVLAVERCLGQTLNVVQAELCDQFVSVWLEGDANELPLDSQARVRDVDLAALSPAQLQVSVLGGCDMWIEDGRVARVWFNYD